MRTRLTVRTGHILIGVVSSGGVIYTVTERVPTTPGRLNSLANIRFYALPRSSLVGVRLRIRIYNKDI
jgi:hypothetical protein